MCGIRSDNRGGFKDKTLGIVNLFLVIDFVHVYSWSSKSNFALFSIVSHVFGNLGNCLKYLLSQHPGLTTRYVYTYIFIFVFIGTQFSSGIQLAPYLGAM